MAKDTVCWRTRFEPRPDITTYELALDMKYVNASQVVSRHYCDKLGTALRHRVLDDHNGERMDVIWSRDR